MRGRKSVCISAAYSHGAHLDPTRCMILPTRADPVKSQLIPLRRLAKSTVRFPYEIWPAYTRGTGPRGRGHRGTDGAAAGRVYSPSSCRNPPHTLPAIHFQPGCFTIISPSEACTKTPWLADT